MYLLDTDTIIYILKGNPVVENNLQRHYHDPIKISVITLMELYYGAYKSQKVTSNLAKVKCPAAAAGPEGLWPGGSCGASNSLKNFPPP